MTHFCFHPELWLVMFIPHVFEEVFALEQDTNRNYLDLTNRNPLIQSTVEVQQLVSIKQPQYIYLDRNNITNLPNQSFSYLNEYVTTIYRNITLRTFSVFLLHQPWHISIPYRICHVRGQWHSHIIARRQWIIFICYADMAEQKDTKHVELNVSYFATLDIHLKGSPSCALYWRCVTV